MKLRDTFKRITPDSIRKYLLQARFALRLPTSSLRVLPDFLLIGTMRGGTSSLFKYLSSHPVVIPSLRKEIWYFSNDKYYQKGEKWYRAHFPTGLYKHCLESLRGRNVLTFEASANYLYSPHAPELIKKTVPEARFIVMLRNPVERLYSHYQYNFRRGVEKRSLVEILEHISLHLHSGGPVMVQEAENTRAIENPFQYFSIGLYEQHLQNWLAHFPLEKFLVLQSEDFFSNTAEAYNQVLRFLELSEWKPAEFRNYSYWGNRRVKEKSQSAMESIQRERVSEWYMSYNEQLYRLIGRRFQWN